MPVYTVKAGDTLERIAMQECGDRSLAQQIARDNNLVDANRIFIGQQLVINCAAAQPPASPPSPPPSPAPVTPPAGGDQPARKTFRVVSQILNVRAEPRTGAAADTPLNRGDEITVRADSWTEAENFRWWQHDRGWSAERSLDGRSIFLEDLTPLVPVAPKREEGSPTPRRTEPGQRVFISVPYHSQEDQDARWAAADCGPTCVRMLIGWNAIRQGQPNPALSVDEVSRETGMGPSRFSFPSQLVRVAGKYGLKLVETRQATPERVRAELDAGRPVISLIRYGSISKRQNIGFRGGHFVVVVGYDDSSYYLNDPDWWGIRRAEGAGLAVPRAEFEAAIGVDSWKAGNPPHWAVLVDPTGL